MAHEDSFLLHSVSFSVRTRDCLGATSLMFWSHPTRVDEQAWSGTKSLQEPRKTMSNHSVFLNKMGDHDHVAIELVLVGTLCIVSISLFGLATRAMQSTGDTGLAAAVICGGIFTAYGVSKIMT